MTTSRRYRSLREGRCCNGRNQTAYCIHDERWERDGHPAVGLVSIQYVLPKRPLAANDDIKQWVPSSSFIRITCIFSAFYAAILNAALRVLPVRPSVCHARAPNSIITTTTTEIVWTSPGHEKSVCRFSVQKVKGKVTAHENIVRNCRIYRTCLLTGSLSIAGQLRRSPQTRPNRC